MSYLEKVDERAPLAMVFASQVQVQASPVALAQQIIVEQRSISATPNLRNNSTSVATNGRAKSLLSPNPRPTRDNPVAQKVQRDRLKANLETMDWESNANAQASIQDGGAEISIRGLAGPYTVVGSNFAPGTTAADIRAAMFPIGGAMQDCRIVSKVPTVEAEMVFSEKARADNVIAAFNNMKASLLRAADGLLLRMYLKLGNSSAPLEASARAAPPRNAPSEPKAARIDLTYEENHYDKQREQSDRSRRRAEPELQDGRYGFEAKEDRLEVDNNDGRGSYRDEQRHSGRGRDVGSPRDERRLYSDDLYRRPRGRGFRTKNLTASCDIYHLPLTSLISPGFADISTWLFLSISLHGSTSRVLDLFINLHVDNRKFNMEVNTATDEPTECPGTAWNEARIGSSIARLQELHARLSGLRDTVSRLVDPMLVQQASPEELYMSFASNATTIKSDIQDFTRLVHDDGSKELFRKAAESRLQNSEDIRGWRVTEHEEWLDVRNVDSLMALGTDSTMAPDQEVPRDLTIEEIRATMEQFNNAHSGIDGSLDEVSKALTVMTLQPTSIKT
ncbi:MAG: hypothetical protein Q9182_002347 [Xanthomendoza sp. 2 TL-2023]